MLKKYKTLKITKNNDLNKKDQNYFTILYKKNNAFASYYNPEQNILKSISTGQLKEYKRFERKTAIASETIVEKVLEFINSIKINSLKKKKIILNIKGLDKFRPEIIQLFIQKKFNIIEINNIFGVPHGGCRSKKQRRK
jgi:ribosomal protein S11